MRFLLTPPGSSHPAVIVETHSTITQQHQDDLRAAMYARSCANGMLFDQTKCLAMRDTYSDMGPQSIRVDLTVSTDEVLKLVEGATLDKKVETWLALLSTSWDHALPPDPAVAKLMYDFVPAAVGTNIHVVGNA